MMKSYQPSAISHQPSVKMIICRTNRQSAVLNNQKKEGVHEQETSFSENRLLTAESRWLTAISIILFLLLLCSCGDEGLVDPHGETTLPSPETTGFHAIDFPTATGSAWTYINVDTNQEFTVRVEGTRDISGTTHRQMTISALTTEKPDEFTLEAVDHLSANAYYLRLDTDFHEEFPYPLLATYFFKTPQALIESAFDIVLPLDNPIYHQKHFPPRRLWDFPLEIGKEWVVFEKTVGIPVTVTRYVAGKDERVTVPAGSYTTYVVHEEVVYGDSPEPSAFLISPPAIYWIAPSVGVVQYRYSRYRATAELFSQTFALKSVYLPE